MNTRVGDFLRAVERIAKENKLDVRFGKDFNWSEIKLHFRDILSNHNVDLTTYEFELDYVVSVEDFAETIVAKVVTHLKDSRNEYVDKCRIELIKLVVRDAMINRISVSHRENVRKNLDVEFVFCTGSIEIVPYIVYIDPDEFDWTQDLFKMSSKIVGDARDELYPCSIAKRNKMSNYVDTDSAFNLDTSVFNYIKNDIENAKRMVKTMINSKYGIPKTFIKDVIFNPPATIVFWNDGTKTVVKAQNNEAFDPEKGLAMAIAKKALGNQGNYFETIKKYTDKYGLIKVEEE